jgi:hypothetical protein
VIWVIDTSAIVKIKTVVPQAQQWKLLKLLESMVEDGHLTFPKQVRDETDDLDHPDAPGVWAVGVFVSIMQPAEPDYIYVQQVMSSEAGKVVDPDKTKEDADPYIIALALQLIGAGHNVCVVTNDQKPQPGRISLSAACDALSVSWTHCRRAAVCRTTTACPPTAVRQSLSAPAFASKVLNSSARHAASNI